MVAFATTDDVAARWRVLASSEVPVVSTLLDDASDMIRVRWPDIDQRLASGAIAEITLVRIVANMVRRAMLNRDSEGVIQYSDSVGSLNHSATLANPANNLYLTADDIAALGGVGFTPRAKIGWLA